MVTADRATMEAAPPPSPPPPPGLSVVLDVVGVEGVEVVVVVVSMLPHWVEIQLIIFGLKKITSFLA